MINEEKLLEAFGDIDDEYLCEEHEIYIKSNKIINLSKYLNKAQNFLKKGHKKSIGIASASILAVAVGLAISFPKLNNGKEFTNYVGGGLSGSIEIANPINQVDSIRKMEASLGFDVPVLNKEVDQYLVIGEKNQEKQGRIIYKDGTEFDIAKGNEDISGIYGGELQTTETIEGVKVSYYKADDTKYVIWSNNGYSYSYQNTYGEIDKAEITELIKLTNN